MKLSPVISLAAPRRSAPRRPAPRRSAAMQLHGKLHSQLNDENSTVNANKAWAYRPSRRECCRWKALYRIQRQQDET